MNTTLGIIIPCHNEAEVIDETASRLTTYLDKLIAAKIISEKSFIKFIDDGSSDDTWQQIAALSAENGLIKGIKLSRNFGHQNALAAGLLNTDQDFDCLVSMDADLQDDILVIEQFLEAFEKGNDIVYGVRSSRVKDSFFKRKTAHGFYRLFSFLGGEIVFDHADFRLVSRRVVEQLRSFSEVNLFLRGIFPLMGFKSAVVPYKRSERYAGKTKYSLRKMMSFSLDGITSFSIKPLRMITLLGFFIFLISMAYALWVIVSLAQEKTVPGWTSTVLPIVLLGGIQILALGLIGEYVGKAYIEIKKRPRYIIEKIVG